MAGAIPHMADPQSADALLAGARANAEASLKQALPGVGFGAMTPAPDRNKLSVSVSGRPPEEQLSPTGAPPDDAVASPGATVEPPPKDAKPVPPTEEPSIHGFLGEEFKGMPRVIGTHLMGGFAKLGKFVAMGAAGATALGENAYNAMANDDSHAATDAAFNFIRDHIDTAYDNWIEKARDQDAGGAAQVLGGVAEGLPGMTTGLTGMAASAGINKATDAVGQGQSVKAAALRGVATAVATAAGMKISHAFPGLTKWVGAFTQRMLSGAAGNTAVTKADQALDKYILNSQGYKDAADKIDLSDPDSFTESGIMGAIFGALDHYHAQKAAGVEHPKQPPTPPKDAKPVTPADLAMDEATPPPPGPPTAARAAPPGVNPAEPNAQNFDHAPGEPGYIPPVAAPATPPKGEAAKAKSRGKTSKPSPDAEENPGQSLADFLKSPDAQVTKPAEPKGQMPLVEDKPSAEPVSDLRAQIADMKDPATPRKGVYLSKENVDRLGPEGVEKLRDGHPKSTNFDGHGGTMIFADQETRAKAVSGRKALDAAGSTDYQGIIGKLTGAGEGKAPDQTAVVQGKTPEGAVTNESAVRPDEVPAKVAEVTAQGKEPVVTTHEDALARREAEIAKEEPATEPATTGKRDTVKTPNGEAEIAKEEPATEPATTGKRVTVKTPNGERALIVEGPEKDGSVPVRLIDDEGNISKAVTQMKAELLRGEAPAKKRGKTKVVVGKDVKPAEGATHEAATAEAPTPEPAIAEAPKSAEAAPAEVAPDHVQTKGEPIPALQASADYLRKADALPEGKKRIGKLGERAAHVAAFARTLKTETLKAFEKGQVDETAVARAARAAEKAERLDKKTTEEIAKGKGISHAELDAHVQELLHAADQLQGKAVPKYDPSAIAAKKQGAKLAKAREQIAREKAEREAPPKKVEPVKPMEKSAIADVPDEVKEAVEKKANLRELTKDERKAVARLTDNFKMASGPDGVEAARRAVLKKLRDIHGDEQYDRHHEAIEQTLENQRDAHNAGDDETPDKYEGIDEAFPTATNARRQKGMHYDEDAGAVGAAEPPHPVLGALHKSLVDSGFYNSLNAMKASGKVASTHRVLDAMVSHAEPGSAIHDLLSKMRAHVDNMPVSAVDVVKHSSGRENRGLAGLFTAGGTPSVQIRTDAVTGHTTGTLIHEILHAATRDFIRTHPDHPLVQELSRLRGVAERRARAQYGDKVIDDNLEYFRKLMKDGEAQKPDFLNKSFYGLLDTDEFVAESHTNSAFQRMLVATEGKSKFTDLVPRITAKLGELIRQIFGVTRPDTGRLIDAVNHISGRIIEAQGRAHAGKETALSEGLDPYNEDFSASLRDDLDAPHKLTNDSKIRAIAGDRMTNVANDFVHAIKSNTWGRIRKTVLPVEALDQIHRSNMHWFGDKNDPSNPLRKISEAGAKGDAKRDQILERSMPHFEKWSRLSQADNVALGRFMEESTRWGIDPTVAKDAHSKVAMARPKFDARYDEFVARWRNLSPASREIYSGIRDLNQWAQHRSRMASIDTALHAFTDQQISPAKRAHLYSVRAGGEYDALVGDGKEIDVGQQNDALKATLKEIAGTHTIDGPFFHLGRHGEHVVQIQPEGSKDFTTRAQAEDFANEIRDLSPKSKADVAENNGKFTVDYEADYVSMHESKADALKEAQIIRDRGLDVGPVTQKIDTATVSPALSSMIDQVSSKIKRSGIDKGDADTLIGSLQLAVTRAIAARSGFAASRLARKGTGGVKPEEMMRSAADYIHSLARGVGSMSSVFEKGEAMGELRNATKNPDNVAGDAARVQKVMFERGHVMDQLSKRAKQELSQFDNHSPGAAAVAALGYSSFLLSPAHTMVNLTQNFTTAMPVAGAHWGYGKTMKAFGRSMGTVTGPAFKSTFLAAIKPGKLGASDVVNAVVEAVSKDPKYAQWTQGANSPFKQLMERGVISSSFSHELGSMASGANRKFGRVMEYARLAPHLADVFNRVSSGLAAMEMTGGDVYKSADFVRETHMDYSQENKPYLFKMVNKNRVPFLNSMTMFKTYTQGMAHLLYSNFYNMAMGETKSRWEAAKTVAGLVVATSIFAGVTKGAILEPVRLGVYAYNKIFGDDDDPKFDIENATDNAMSDWLGETAGELVSRGLPRAFDADVGSRMGLSDLFFHDPPDLLSADPKAWAEFTGQLMGPMGEMLSKRLTGFFGKMSAGDPLGAFMDAIPVKALDDSRAAFQYYTEGKINARGAQITDPSGSDALARVLGFTPGNVAKASQRSEAVYEYRDNAGKKREQLLNKAVRDGWGSNAYEIQQFNQANPGLKLRPRDVLKQKASNRRTEKMVRGQAGKDSVVNDIVDY